MATGQISIIVLFTIFSMVLSAETYSSKYDNVDVDEILNNQRLYQKYFDCIAGKGKCTPDGTMLKENIPDALENECSKCNENQKKRVEQVFKFLITQKPGDYKILEDMYDPDGVYRKKYEEQKKMVEKGQAVKL